MSRFTLPKSPAATREYAYRETRAMRLAGVPAHEAYKRVKQLIRDQGLVDDWYEETAVASINQNFTEMMRQERSVMGPLWSPPEHVTPHTDPMLDPEMIWTCLIYVGGGRWRQLADATRSDWDSIDQAYSRRQRNLQSRRRVVRKIREHIPPGKTTRECFSTQEITDVLRSNPWLREEHAA